ncbi:MAG: hypothetical protein HN894_15565 [Bacteroidetes bacterium]|jgi:hypothetical protein|nr:hypothetical protein [Bacteroidota bacterium]
MRKIIFTILLIYLFSLTVFSQKKHKIDATYNSAEDEIPMPDWFKLLNNISEKDKRKFKKYLSDGEFYYDNCFRASSTNDSNEINHWPTPEGARKQAFENARYDCYLKNFAKISITATSGGSTQVDTKSLHNSFYQLKSKGINEIIPLSELITYYVQDRNPKRKGYHCYMLAYFTPKKVNLAVDSLNNLIKEFRKDSKQLTKENIDLQKIADEVSKLKENNYILLKENEQQYSEIENIKKENARLQKINNEDSQIEDNNYTLLEESNELYKEIESLKKTIDSLKLSFEKNKKNKDQMSDRINKLENIIDSFEIVSKTQKTNLDVSLSHKIDSLQEIIKYSQFGIDMNIYLSQIINSNNNKKELLNKSQENYKIVYKYYKKTNNCVFAYFLKDFYIKMIELYEKKIANEYNITEKEKYQSFINNSKREIEIINNKCKPKN